MDVLTDLSVVIISKCIHISKHHFIHCKCIQFYLSIILQSHRREGSKGTIKNDTQLSLSKTLKLFWLSGQDSVVVLWPITWPWDSDHWGESLAWPLLSSLCHLWIRDHNDIYIKGSCEHRIGVPSGLGTVRAHRKCSI